MRRILVVTGLSLVGLVLALESVRQASKVRPFAQISRASAGRPLGVSQPLRSTNHPESSWFTDITDRSKIEFVQAVGPLGTFFMPEINGSGCSILDYDNDGDLDIFFVNLGKSPKASSDFPPGTRVSHALFRREPDGTYSDQTEAVGLLDLKKHVPGLLGIGCAVGDVNNDGNQDIYLTNYGADQLLLNLHGKRFHDCSLESGLGCELWGTAAAFFDYDRDGWLDLFVVNYSMDDRFGHTIACGQANSSVSYCGPHKFQPVTSRLYHNEGAESLRDGIPRFTDVSKTAGIDGLASYGLGLAVCDFDGDYWPDVFLASDMTENRLWINQRNGSFREEAVLRGCALSGEGMKQGCMGTAIGDLDHDGDFDIVVTNLVTEGSTLYLNDGNGNFTDQSRPSLLVASTLRHTGWGAAMIDLDLDGDLDLPMVNGFVVPGGSMFPPHGEDRFQNQIVEVLAPNVFLSPYYDSNQLLLNQGNGKFLDVSHNAGDFSREQASSRSLAFGDLDQDGDLDLVTTCVGGRARLYRNDMPRAGNWLKVSCRLPRLARDAIGAVVRVRVGSRTFISQISSSTSYLASNEPVAHFGLGKAQNVDCIEVVWPDGTVDSFPGVKVDQHITLNKPGH